MKKIVNFAAAGGTVDQCRTLQAAGWINATFCGAMGGATNWECYEYWEYWGLVLGKHANHPQQTAKIASH